MSESQELSVVAGSDLTKDMAALYRVPPAELIKTIKAQCFPNGAASDAQLVMFLTVCRERKLNPFMKEVYAFMQGGKMQIGVEVDGWIRKANEHPQYDGCSFDDLYVNDKLFSVTCKIFRKDRKHAGEYTALFSEWNVASNQVWKDKPRHMLGIKAFNQFARFMLGLTGISDNDTVEPADVNERKAEIEEAEIVDQETGEVVNAKAPAEVAAQTEPITETAEGKVDDAPTAEAAPAAEPAPKSKGRPKSAKTRLKELSKDVAPNRIVVMCGQFGVAKIDDFTEEQAAEAIARLERRGK